MRKGQQLKQQNNSEQSSVKLGTPGVLLVCSGTLLVTLLRQEEWSIFEVVKTFI